MLPVVMPPMEKLDWRQLQVRDTSAWLIVQAILELPQSSGILGGCDNRGCGAVGAAHELLGGRYYIFGSHAASFLALDPHYVTTEFSCREPKVIKGGELDASLLMVFVLNSQVRVLGVEA